jgi:hypothetical protein
MLEHGPMAELRLLQYRQLQFEVLNFSTRT